MIKFTLPLIPETMQHETRIGHMKAKPGQSKGMPFMFSTKKKKDYLAHIAALARPYVPKECPWLGPIHLELLFVLPRPKYAMHRSYEDGLIWAPVYPDITNLTKAFEDGLSGAEFWKNDSQIVRGKQRKVFHEKLVHPRVEVGIESLGGPLL